jgi:hypothetical protein
MFRDAWERMERRDLHLPPTPSGHNLDTAQPNQPDSAGAP